MFQLPELKELAALPGVRHVDFDQCCFGAESVKPTRLLFYGVDLTELSARCNRKPTRVSYRDRSGRT
eukprot:10667452-Alexandrium_andersonii.AAC.1